MDPSIVDAARVRDARVATKRALAAVSDRLSEAFFLRDHGWRLPPSVREDQGIQKALAMVLALLDHPVDSPSYRWARKTLSGGFASKASQGRCSATGHPAGSEDP